MSEAPRSARNNNPGNIEHHPSFRWQGELDHDPAIESRFARFDTPTHGFRALARNLLMYSRSHGLRTVRQIINRWAPPVENETTAYVAAVARALQVHPDTPLDLEALETLRDLARAIATHETGGWEQWWREEDLALGVNLALERPLSPAPPQQAEAGRPKPAEPRKDTPMAFPIVPIVAALLPQIIAAIPDLARIISRPKDPETGRQPKVSERNVQILERVGEIMIGATGEETVEGAVRKLQTDQAAREAATRQVRLSFPELIELAEMGERSTGAARAFGERMTQTGPAWRNFGFAALLAILAIGTMAGGGWMLREVLTGPETDQQTKGLIIGFLIAALTQVLAYFFGSSASSRTKDQALVDAVERR